MAAEDERGDEHHTPKEGHAQEGDHAGRVGALSRRHGFVPLMRRHQGRGACRRDEERRLEHDDRSKSPGIDDLAAEQCADHEDRGSGSAYPAIFERRMRVARLRGPEGQCIGERRGRCKRRGMQQTHQEERREAGCR